MGHPAVTGDAGVPARPPPHRRRPLVMAISPRAPHRLPSPLPHTRPQGGSGARLSVPLPRRIHAVCPAQGRVPAGWPSAASGSGSRVCCWPLCRAVRCPCSHRSCPARGVATLLGMARCALWCSGPGPLCARQPPSTKAPAMGPSHLLTQKQVCRPQLVADGRP